MIHLKRAIQMLQSQQFEKFTVDELNEMPRGTKLITDVHTQRPVMLIKQKRSPYKGVWFDTRTKERHPSEAVVYYFEGLLNLDFAVAVRQINIEN